MDGLLNTLKDLNVTYNTYRNFYLKAFELSKALSLKRFTKIFYTISVHFTQLFAAEEKEIFTISLALCFEVSQLTRSVDQVNDNELQTPEHYIAPNQLAKTRSVSEAKNNYQVSFVALLSVGKEVHDSISVKFIRLIFSGCGHRNKL